MIKHNALDQKLVLIQDRTGLNRGWRQLLPAEGLSCTELAYAFTPVSTTSEAVMTKSNGCCSSRFNLLSPKLVLDTVGEAGRTDEMQRHSPMQTDAEEPVEAGKVIHVGTRHKGMVDAQELPRKQIDSIAATCKQMSHQEARK